MKRYLHTDIKSTLANKTFIVEYFPFFRIISKLVNHYKTLRERKKELAYSLLSLKKYTVP